MCEGQNRYGLFRQVIDYRKRKAPQHVLPAAVFVNWPAQWRVANLVNSAEDFNEKPTRGQGAPLAIPDKCIADVCFGFRSENNFKVAHKAPRRARASGQGTACVAPERSAFVRRRISSAQALPIVASSSPSRLSSSAMTRAERSSGASANASSRRWSMRAFMLASLALQVRGAPPDCAGYRRRWRVGILNGAVVSGVAATEASSRRAAPKRRLQSDAPLARDYRKMVCTKVQRPIWPLDAEMRPSLIL